MLISAAEMTGLSYFAIQIESGIFKLQSKSNRKFLKIWSPSPNKIQKIDKIQLVNNKN